ncbi:hypothetical protein BaRGS_00003546, partial [Batillaria attramentaria]
MFAPPLFHRIAFVYQAVQRQPSVACTGYKRLGSVPYTLGTRYDRKRRAKSRNCNLLSCSLGTDVKLYIALGS